MVGVISLPFRETVVADSIALRLGEHSVMAISTALLNALPEAGISASAVLDT